MSNNLDFNQKRGFICDMDGVIYYGNRILPGVREFIQWLQDEKKEYLFLTNNSGYTPKELNQKLARMGLDVPEAVSYTPAPWPQQPSFGSRPLDAPFSPSVRPGC